MDTPTERHLHLDATFDPTNKAGQLGALEHCIQACQKGDPRAQTQLANHFGQLIHSLAAKRAHGKTAEITRLCARGRDGLLRAAAKYQPKIGAAHFNVFALDFIEKAMDENPGGFWRRLFGRS